MIVEQHPRIRIIMVFGDPNRTISKRSTMTYAEYSGRLGIEVLNKKELSLVLYLAHEEEFPLARENVVHQPSHQRRCGRRIEDVPSAGRTRSRPSCSSSSVVTASCRLACHGAA